MSGHRITGLCSSHPDPDLWFREDPESEAAAKAICRRCPSQTACAVAGRDEPYGVRAGLTVGERLGLMLLATPDPPPHVASRGHYNSGCRHPDCCAANTRFVAEYRAREHASPGVTGGARVDLGEQLSLEVA